ncbi:putative transcriptional regulatory protein NarL [Posidoniimonas corsicana]|uniref:Putative transcriptional regulatory protein NarL n=1 Tax=Posidoniimonas corsicana TaxID=1938618 RepID=A0A5C5V040_9BACT|nr:helix-turn-helix transcriptional regulator [Posidoniimonas corsicana]TWT31102.1 putative transcriptional regulatory protein NarL [Posidoniimonas corsicana]
MEESGARSKQQDEHPIASSDLFDLAEWELVCAELSLSERQADIVARIISGKSDQAIAHALGISTPTVRAHLHRVFESLKVNDRVSLLVQVFRTLRNLDRV